MKKVLTLLLLSAFTLGNCKSDDTTVYPVETKTTQFPKSWEGNWKGEVNIFSANGNQNVPMSLVIQLVMDITLRSS